MDTKLIKGLNQIQSNYDAFFIDLWGVIHNGIKLHPGAVEVLENLNKLNKRFVLMSNAPRPSKSVEKFLLKLKLNKILLKNIFIRDDGNVLSQISSTSSTIFAKSGYLTEDEEHLILHNGNIQKLKKDNTVDIVKFEKTFLVFRLLINKLQNLPV